MRQVAGFLPPYTASAPSGSIRLDSAIGWGNPPLTEASPLQAGSGLPVVLAAGRTISVGNFPYGFAYSKDRGDTSGPIKIATGMAIPRVVWELPVPNYESGLVDSIHTAMTTLLANSKELADRSEFLNKPAPGVADMVRMFTKQEWDNIEEWTSLQASLSFGFPTIPRPGTKTLPMPGPPTIGPVILLTFYPPYPADGHTANEEAELQRKIQEHEAQIQIHRRRLYDIELDIRKLKGDPYPVSRYGEKPLPARIGVMPIWDPDLVGDQYMDKVHILVHEDRLTVERAVQMGQTELVTANLVSSQQLLRYFATFKGYGDDNLRKHDVHALGGPDHADANRAYDEKSVVPVLFNFGVLDRLEYHETIEKVRAKDGQEYERVASQSKFDGQKVVEGRSKIDEKTWRRILDVVDPKAIRFQEKRLPVGDSWLQMQLLRFIDLDVDFYDSPNNRSRHFLEELQSAKAWEEEEMASAIQELEAAFHEISKIADRSIALTRAAQPRDGKNRYISTGQPGSCYSRFGWSFDVLWKIGKAIAEGSFMGQYCPSYPTIFYGYPDTVLAGALADKEHKLSLKSIFTVPQGRTFHYDGDLEVRGDIWLQRGSTLAVRGNVWALAYTREPKDIKPYDPLNPFQPCGRILMEEGSNLVVGGNLYTNGSRERGSLVVCGCPGSVHPINAAVLCEGEVHLPFGTRTGMAMCDALAVRDYETRRFNCNVIRPYFETIAPAAGKFKGPFHGRIPFFCEFAPRYAIGVWEPCIPFVFPQPAPVEPSLKNMWILGYRLIGLMHQYSNNAHLGENLYPQCDWWPERMRLDEIGVAPVFPKLAPTSLRFVPILLQLPWKKSAVDGMIDGAVSLLHGVLLSKLQFWLIQDFGMAADLVAPYIQDMLEFLEFENDDANQPMNVFGSKVTTCLNDFMSTAIEALIKLPDEASWQDSFMKEVAGVLIYAREIEIGKKDGSPQPFLASGMFVALNDININAKYTVGTLVSQRGSINPDPMFHTNFLSYPFFSRASLYAADPNPPYNFTGFLATLPRPQQKLYDVRYGTRAPQGSALDLLGQPTFQITAEGWR